MLAYDKHSLDSVRHYDENGFLHVDVCNITKEQVAPYYGREIPGWQKLGLVPDKIYYGYRPFEEIEKAAETFNNLPLLSEHVEDGADKKNQHLRVGSLGTNAKAQEPYLTNSLAVYDEKSIKSIESGEKKELSSAYRYDPVFKPGFFDGQKYDFRMENIRGNHVALVKEGRAGSDVVVADSNSITKGEKMSTKLKNFISKLSSKKDMAMDEDLEEALKEAIREEVKEIVPEVKVEEDVTEDAESVDKRKLIDEIGGILKGKIDEELWRTVIGKAEKLAYNDSTRSADDEDIKAEDGCAKDADFAEGVKYGEEMEKKERKKLDREHESEGAKAAMDAASIRLSIMNEFKQKTLTETMQAAIKSNQNWVTFMPVFQETDEQKQELAVWCNSKGTRFAYVSNEVNGNALVPNNAACFAQKVKDYYGIFNAYNTKAFCALAMGYAASMDLERTNGRKAFAYRSQAGLAYTVDDAEDARALLGNGYNFYGSYATAAEEFTLAQNGQISGSAKWFDTYLGQIWLKARMQAAWLTVLKNANTLPFNVDGYSAIYAGSIDVINAGLNAGLIVPGVNLSAAQIDQVNREAGMDISETLYTQGWFLQIPDADTQTRVARGPLRPNFWYCDGGSIQTIQGTSTTIL